MFGRVPFPNPYEQLFGAYPVHPFQQYPIGMLPNQPGPMGAGFGASPWQGAQTAGYGPISPLLPQQGGLGGFPQGSPFIQQQLPIPPVMGQQGIPFGAKPQGLFDPSFLGGGQFQSNPLEQILGIGQGGQQIGQSPFGYGQAVNPMAQTSQYGGAQTGFGGAQSWQPAYTQQRDPRAELLANTIAQITATRDPRVEYLAQIVTHPAVASNPVLKDLVAKELLTAALQQVTLKSSRQGIFGQSPFGGEQSGLGQGIDPYTAAAVKSQVLAELANSQLSQLLQGGQSAGWGGQQNVHGGLGQQVPQFSAGTQTTI